MSRNESNVEYYQIEVRIDKKPWSVYWNGLSLASARGISRDNVDRGWPKNRIRIRPDNSAHGGEFPKYVNPKYYPRVLADSPEQAREWHGRATRNCVPMSKILGEVSEMLKKVEVSDENETEDPPARPF